jgi:hypothetical protein
MSGAHSISTRQRFGMTRVCSVWGVSRATVYRHRAAAGAANTPRRIASSKMLPKIVRR